MTRQNPFDLRMAPHGCVELIGTLSAPLPIQGFNADFIGRMMHKQHCRLRLIPGQLIIQPSQSFRAKSSAFFSGNHGINPDKPDRKIFHRILHKPGGRQVGMVRKCVGQSTPFIMIAWYDEQRRVNRIKNFAHVIVLDWMACLNQVAAMNHQIRLRVHAIDFRDASI